MTAFKNPSNAFNLVYEDVIPPGETVYIKMPPVSSNKRGINDIGWQTDNNELILYGTLSGRPKKDDTMWDRIYTAQDVNKTTAYIKAVNPSDKEAKLIIRAIMN